MLTAALAGFSVSKNAGITLCHQLKSKLQHEREQQRQLEKGEKRLRTPAVAGEQQEKKKRKVSCEQPDQGTELAELVQAPFPVKALRYPFGNDRS